MRKIFLNIALIATAVCINSCITPFEPEGVSGIDNMVVIEGDIIQNDTTKVTVSRSLAIKDENKINYIKSAKVWVESETGQIYSAKEILKNGVTKYFINTIGIDPKLKYKLCVKLFGGQTYNSDFLPVLVSPPIDSIGFVSNFEDRTTTFYVNTHDPRNQTRYYKWNYTENWEFNSQYMSLYEYDRFYDRVNEIDFDKNRYICWGSATSSQILTATTENLTEDVVYRKPLTRMDYADKKISVLYSMELTQMAISKESYDYWENLKKNSDDIGGIFSPQPSEISGNIHCISDTTERVIGYIGAGSIARKRIFATRGAIGIYENQMACETILVNAENLIDFKSLHDSGYDIVSYSDSPRESYWAIKSCVDCRVFGTKFKPSFWPNDHK